MKKKVFFIGGFGNNLIQLYTAHKANNNKYPEISSIFNNPYVRKLLGQTNHVDFFKNNDLGINKISIFWHFVVIFDLFLASIFKISLFSRIDLLKINATPLIKEIIYLGYFQSNISMIHLSMFLKDFISNTDLNAEIKENKQANKICVVHFRGGDFNDIGLVKNYAFYKKSMDRIKNYYQGVQFKVVTNDKALFLKTFDKMDLKDIHLISGSMQDDFKEILSCDFFIGTFSTFSVIAALASKKCTKIILNNKVKKIFRIDDSRVEIIK